MRQSAVNLLLLSYDKIHMDWTGYIESLDQHLKSGRADLAVKAIGELNLSTTPRPERLALARICRRTGLFVSGLKLLTPLIQPKNRLEDPPSIAEQAEYAALLTKNGSTNEALNRLLRLGSESHADVALFTGFSYMADWDYKSAANYLRRYLEMQNDEYASLVARVNLSACLVSLNAGEALDQLNHDIELSERRGFARILANCLELRAQHYLRTEEWKNCRQDLERASNLLKSEKTSDQLFVNKWTAFLMALEGKTREPLMKFRSDAKNRRHWESVRAVDQYLLQIQFDSETFNHLIFGTPYKSFRETIFHELGRQPRDFYYTFGDKNAPGINLFTGEVHGINVGSVDLKAHLLVDVLMRDFYRPTRFGEMFFALYPEEYFDIFSSPNRLHQYMHRARKWLTVHRMPLQIVEEDSAYRLEAESPFHFVVPFQRADTGESQIYLQKLYASYGFNNFSAKEACQLLDLSRVTFQRWAEVHEGRGFLVREFQGPATRYRILRLQQKTAA